MVIISTRRGIALSLVSPPALSKENTLILQTDPLLNEKINKYGCYLMSILFLVNKHTGRGFDRSDINYQYYNLRDTPFMDEDCFMDDPPEVFTFLGLPMACVMIAQAGYIPAPDQLEILHFKRRYWNNEEGRNITYGHFTVGNGTGSVTYDPAGNSNAVKYGHLESKRIFTRSN